MLDVKLANYCPFVELMAAAGGGMFVTASDDIEAIQIDRDQIKGNIGCLGLWLRRIMASMGSITIRLR